MQKSTKKLKIFSNKDKEELCFADKINATFVSINHSGKKMAFL
jgi:hypothetical protein